MMNTPISLPANRWLIVGVFALVALLVTHPQTYDPDIYWHLRSGQVMLDTGDVIRGDTFSHTLTGELRPHHEWLGEIVMIGFYNALGDYGLTLLATLLSLAALGLMFWLMRGVLGVRLLMVVVTATATLPTAMARPQAWMVIFTLVIMAMVLRRGISLRWLPVVMLAWGNLHGGWVMGFIVLGAGVFSEALKLLLRRGGNVRWLGALVGWSLAGAAALLVNPYGVDQLLVPFDTLTQAARPFLIEWLPPNLLAADRLSFTLLVGLSAAVLVVERRRIALVEAVLLIGFGVWSLTTARVVTVFMFVAPVLVTPYLSGWIAARMGGGLRLTRLHAALAVALALAVVARFIGENSPAGMQAITRRVMPVAAVEALLERQPPRELFNDYGWGGYLIWRAPEYPVFIDGRADLYDDFFFTYLDIVSLTDGWQAELEAWGVNTVLIGAETPLAEALAAEPGWSLAYSDALAALYVRDQ